MVRYSEVRLYVIEYLVANYVVADEGREGDDELSEGDDGSSVCGLPCAVPWWEEGEMDGTDDATHRPQFPSQLQHILDGIKAAVTTEHTTAGGTIADSHTINSLLKSSAANLLNPSIPKRQVDPTNVIWVAYASEISSYV